MNDNNKSFLRNLYILGDFLQANEMLGFVHLLYVQNCTFLYILNELNRVN